MIRHALVVLLVASASALADSPRGMLTEADMVLERAQAMADQGLFNGGQCIRKVPDRIEAARDALADAAEDEDAQDERSYRMQLRSLKRAQRRVDQASDEARSARCAPQVSALLGVAVARLRHAEERLEELHRGNWLPMPPPPAGPPPASMRRVELGALQVYDNQPYQGALAVRVDVSRATLVGFQGAAVGFTAQVRAEGGRLGEVFRSGPVTIPASPYVWDNAYAQYFRYPELRRLDLGSGHFVAHLALVDDQGRELAAQEAPFELHFGVRPETNPLPLPPTAAARDCGTGPEDVGCVTPRGGRWAMDAETFLGLTTTLRATASEFSKKEMTDAVLKDQLLTAKQLGVLLDFFQSEFNRLELAKLAVPKLTNPSAALGLSVKFDSTFNRSEFVKLVTAQR